MNIIDLRLEKDCIQTLAEWHHCEWAHLNPGSRVEKRIEKMQAYLGATLIPSMFICKEGDQLLGSAAIVSNDMDTKTELAPWLASVYVRQDYRNRGFGTALVGHVINIAKEAGYSNLYLFTPIKRNSMQRWDGSLFLKNCTVANRLRSCNFNCKDIASRRYEM